jgi:osmoprotectant transport system substrate-binding protein
MRTRRILATTLGLGALMLGTACAADDVGETDSGTDSGSTEDKGSVNLLSQDFTEAAIVTNMYKLLLEDAGYTVDMKLVGTRDIYMRLLPDDVDVVPEYVGGVADYLNTEANGAEAEPITTSDPEETLEKVQPLAEEKGVTLLEPAEASDQNAFFVTQEFADANSLTTLSDLAALGEPVVLAAAEDCGSRPDCGAGLRDTYGIEISKVLGLGFASPQTYESVLSGESQLGLTSTTDGSLESQGLTLLEDDQQIQPAQNLVPMVRTAFLEENADVEELLNGLMAEISTEDLTELNGQVGNERALPEDVARDYLEEKELL